MHANQDLQPAVFARNASKRILLALAFLFPWASPVAATTYYVSTSGSDTNAGTQAAPWRTLAKANATLVAGDACMIAAGTYSDPIQPANSGANYRPGGMITYVGSIANPAGTVVRSLVLRNQYASVKGVTVSTTAAAMLSGVHDSLSYCDIAASWAQVDGGSDNVMSNCTINSSHFFFDGSGSGDTTAMVARDTIRNCTFNLSPTVDLSSITMSWRGVKDCVIENCRFNITASTSVTGGGFTKMFTVQNNRIADCNWTMTSNRTVDCDECNWFVMRDRTRNNAFVRDTFTMVIQAGSSDKGAFHASVAGNVGNNYGCFGNKFDHCTWRTPEETDYGAAVHFQDAAYSDTLSYCTIVSRDAAIKHNGRVANVVIDHCTFVSLNSPYAVWDAHDITSEDRVPWYGTSVVTNSIFCSLSGRHGPGYPATSIKTEYAAGHIAGNNNLFYTAMSADSAINTGNGMSAPGTGHLWYNVTGADGQSTHGNPLFVGGTSVLNYDVHLQPSSPAIGRGVGGSDIGAFPFVAGGGDVTPPAAVTDLVVVQVSNDYALLRWTAPGDNGSTGTVAAYDLRYSTQPINAANFATATQVPTAPAILVAGSAQSYGLTGLTASTSYYFALKARDAASNWSAVSNVPTATTTAADQLAPARITDFR
jgi:hypothetical protein